MCFLFYFAYGIFQSREINMNRYEIVKDFVYSKYAKITYEPLRIAAITHTSGVDTCITFLAISRGIKPEKAKIAALLHDYAQFVENCPHAQHASLSSIFAHKYLKETGLFKVNEIDDICFAISEHSKKDQYDSPLCELLKDADVLARFLENPDQELTGIRKQRLLDAFADIND